jgi:hypothetical protein
MSNRQGLPKWPDKLQSQVLYRPSQEKSLQGQGYMEVRWLAAIHNGDGLYAVVEQFVHLRQSIPGFLFPIFDRECNGFHFKEIVPEWKARLDIGAFEKEARAKIASGEFEGMAESLDQVPLKSTLLLKAARRIGQGIRSLRSWGTDPKGPA